MYLATAVFTFFDSDTPMLVLICLFEEVRVVDDVRLLVFYELG